MPDSHQVWHTHTHTNAQNCFFCRAARLMFPRLQLPQGQLTQSVPPPSRSPPPHHSRPSEVTSPRAPPRHPSPALMGLQEQQRHKRLAHTCAHFLRNLKAPTPAARPAPEIKLTSHHTLASPPCSRRQSLTTCPTITHGNTTRRPPPHYPLIGTSPSCQLTGILVRQPIEDTTVA